MSRKKKVIRSSMLFVLLFTCFIVCKPIEAKSTYEPFFTLVAKTSPSSRYDILNLVWQQLRRIGIEIIPISMEWVPFLNELLVTRDFDLCYLDITGGEADPDWSLVYGENAALNIFGYDTNMDWNDELGTGRNEWYLQQGKLIMPPDSEERIQHYWEWENYLMDEILPLIPFFTHKTFTISWSTLYGYDANEGLKTSWGKLSWDGLHEGQENTSQIITNIKITWPTTLNPLIIRNNINNFIFDSLVTYDYDLNFYPHLANDWLFLNNTHLRMHLREGIKWQIDPDGLFPNEYFDADDVVFSFYAWKNFSEPIIRSQFFWLEDVKKIDQYTVDFFIDQNSSTAENEPYAPIFKYLVREILPEHYLNQSQLADGKTPDITHDSWTTFSTNSFGTSLFKLDDCNDAETNLILFEDCWWLDPAVEKTNMNFESRFGDFSGNITKLKIRTNLDDKNILFATFELGQLDLLDIGSDFILRDEFQGNQDYAIYNSIPFTFAFLGFNMQENRDPLGNRDPAPGDPSITKGLAIRKAISYAIDRDEINQVMFGGEFLIQDYPFYQRLGKWCNPNIIRYNQNLDKAREYMRKAGYGAEFPQGKLSLLEITVIVFSFVFVVGTISFISYRTYKKNKL